jgi:peptide/nickel transport system substrate-binding protein
MISKSTKILLSIFILIVFILVGGNQHGMASQELADEQVAVLSLTTGDIGNIDPAGTIMTQDAAPRHHIFGSLVRHPLGNALSPNFEPDLATKWGISSDKLTWTFHLRKGVKWHWGYGEVTAEDVVYSLNRVKNSKVSAWRGNYTGFKKIEATDKYTVQITTSKPEPFLLTKVANFFGGWIVCKKAVEKANKFDKLLSPVKDEMVGTGPFKFLEYVSKDRIVLVRNDDFWEGKPILEKLVYKYISAPTSRELALLKGEIAGGLGLYDRKWINHIKSKGILVEPMAPIGMKTLFINSRVKPFDNKKVRQALAYAMSQQSQVDANGEGVSEVCTSPVPSNVHGHIDAGWGKHKRDVAKARKLLAEAGYPNGLTIKMFASTAHWYAGKMLIIQNEWKEAGIDLQMTSVDHTVYKGKSKKGLNPIVIWGGRYPLATYWLRDMYHSESMLGKPRSAHNYMYYSNPELDRLTELAESTFNDKERVEALAKAQRLIVEDLPSIPVVEEKIPCVRHSWFDLGHESISNFLWHYDIGIKSRILKH